MNVLFVTYDLVDPGRNYEELLKKIKAYHSWAKLGGSAYLIETNKRPTEVRDNLKTVLDQNDNIFVGTAVAPAAWYGLAEAVSSWVLERLK